MQSLKTLTRMHYLMWALSSVSTASVAMFCHRSSSSSRSLNCCLFPDPGLLRNTFSCPRLEQSSRARLIIATNFDAGDVIRRSLRKNGKCEEKISLSRYICSYRHLQESLSSQRSSLRLPLIKAGVRSHGQKYLKEPFFFPQVEEETKRPGDLLSQTH